MIGKSSKKIWSYTKDEQKGRSRIRPTRDEEEALQEFC